MSIRILPYSTASKTAKDLSRILGVKMIHHIPSKSKYGGSATDLVYNYGNNLAFKWTKNTEHAGLLLNTPESVEIASSKATYLSICREHNVPVPDFTDSMSDATEWIAEGHVVYCRTLTRASQGRGIVVAHKVDELVSAPLYTKGITNVKREYRAHVFKGEVIDLVAKATRNGEPASNDEIRNLKNGWIFVRDAVTIPESVREELVAIAITALEVVSLDVAAVDLIRDSSNNILVLEVNTAPGMEGTTLDRYADALIEHHQLIKTW